MNPVQDHPDFDVILVGMGLGATSVARSLARAGQRVGIVAGVGRSRSPEADGGLVDAELVEQAFGPDAPLGAAVDRRQVFISSNVEGAYTPGGLNLMSPRRAYRRLDLETWARNRAVEAGAIYLEGFVEAQVMPLPTGEMTLVDESGTTSLRARTIVLCEGSDPRIAMRVGLRPDYPPEDQVHFARTVLAAPMDDLVYRHGRTRTSWGMPVGLTVVPLGATTLVAVDSRIENVMRGARSTQEALLDALSSPLGASLGLWGERIHTGMELTALRRETKDLRLSAGPLLVGIDASGVIDAREVQRADAAIRSGLHLADWLGGSRDDTWDAFAMSLVAQVRAADPHWHDSRVTHYVEESAAEGSVKASVTRIGKSVLGRFQRGAKGTGAR